MKPRIKLLHRWYDCGHIYERWMCQGNKVTAFGVTPHSAYTAWTRETALASRSLAHTVEDRVIA